MHYCKKKFGQHFLINPVILAELIQQIDPQPNEHLVEIGPGSGALTTKLLPLVQGITAIEIDPTVIPVLRANCNHSTKLTIYLADILQFDFQQLPTSYRLVGNLAYNIATPLLFRLIHYRTKIPEIYVMLQKEVADRIVAQPDSKNYGRLTVMLQYYFTAEILLSVPASAFAPVPQIESSFIRLVPQVYQPLLLQQQHIFAQLVAQAFQHRRKTIQNNLKTHFSPAQLIALNIDPQARAENLTVEDFVKLSQQLSETTLG